MEPSLCLRSARLATSFSSRSPCDQASRFRPSRRRPRAACRDAGHRVCAGAALRPLALLGARAILSRRTPAACKTRSIRLGKRSAGHVLTRNVWNLQRAHSLHHLQVSAATVTAHACYPWCVAGLACESWLTPFPLSANQPSLSASTLQHQSPVSRHQLCAPAQERQRMERGGLP